MSDRSGFVIDRLAMTVITRAAATVRMPRAIAIWRCWLASSTMASAFPCSTAATSARSWTMPGTSSLLSAGQFSMSASPVLTKRRYSSIWSRFAPVRKNSSGSLVRADRPIEDLVAVVVEGAQVLADAWAGRVQRAAGQAG